MKWDAKKFGDRLYLSRHTLRMTQRNLQEASGVNERTIRSLEKGQGIPNIDTIYRLAAALGTTPQALLP